MSEDVTSESSAGAEDNIEFVYAHDGTVVEVIVDGIPQNYYEQEEISVSADQLLPRKLVRTESWLSLDSPIMHKDFMIVGVCALNYESAQVEIRLKCDDLDWKHPLSGDWYLSKIARLLCVSGEPFDDVYLSCENFERTKHDMCSQCGYHFLDIRVTAHGSTFAEAIQDAIAALDRVIAPLEKGVEVARQALQMP